MKHSAATQREKIRQYLYSSPRGATRNVIARDSGVLVQTLCRRLRELEDLGHIARMPRVHCPVTGTLNIEYRLSGSQRAAMTRKGVAA